VKSTNSPTKSADLGELLASMDLGEMRDLLAGLYGLSEQNKNFMVTWVRKRKGTKRSNKSVELVDVRELVSLPQVASEYGFHPNYLRRLAVKKRIPGCFLVGGSWIATRSALNSYLKSKSSVGRPRTGAE